MYSFGCAVSRLMGITLLEVKVMNPADRKRTAVLGAVTLESLGLILDPLKRQLRPLPMLMI